MERLRDSGYRITDDPDFAYFMLQANVLKVGRDNLEATDSYLEAGFSGAAIGSATGHFLRIPKRQMSVVVACGVSAGISGKARARLC